MSKDQIAEALPEQLFALHDRVRAELRSLCGEIKLTDAQVGVLWRISAEQDTELTSGQLADRIGCDASTVTSLVDRLERHGVLVRVAHPHDRRAKILRLTPLGCELRDRVEQYRRHGSPFAALSPEEQERLHELLERTIDGDPRPAR